jgi:hypothetical protein
MGVGLSAGEEYPATLKRCAPRPLAAMAPSRKMEHSLHRWGTEQCVCIEESPMVTQETDGFKVLTTWNHHGTIVHRRSPDPAQFVELGSTSDPGTFGRKGGPSMTADERKAARNRWQNR